MQIHSHLATASPKRPALSRRERVFTVFLLASWAILAGSTLWAAENEVNEITQPFEGVRVIHSKSMVPRPLDMWVVEIDPSARGIRFLVTPSNGSLEGDTTPQTTREFVTKAGAQLGINGSFFKWAGKSQLDVSGLSASNGDVYSEFQKGYVDALNISRDNVPTIIRGTGKENKAKLSKVVAKREEAKAPASKPLPEGEGSKAASSKSDVKKKKEVPVIPLGTAHRPDVRLYNALSGRTRLVKNGKNVADNSAEIHPRTAAGITADGKLLLFTVDGREKGRSEGMKFSELADALIRWGAHDAVSLDGGGSTTFVMDDPATPANDPRVMNLPCDLLPNKERGKERTVANNLAVFARRKAGSAKPQAAGIRKGVRAKAGS